MLEKFAIFQKKIRNFESTKRAMNTFPSSALIANGVFSATWLRCIFLSGTVGLAITLGRGNKHTLTL